LAPLAWSGAEGSLLVLDILIALANVLLVLAMMCIASISQQPFFFLIEKHAENGRCLVYR
jgi:hypothetical protein